MNQLFHTRDRQFLPSHGTRGGLATAAAELVATFQVRIDFKQWPRGQAGEQSFRELMQTFLFPPFETFEKYLHDLCFGRSFVRDVSQAAVGPNTYQLVCRSYSEFWAVCSPVLVKP